MNTPGAAHTIFIHCGLHKTGTTAIQLAFEQHRALLCERGILYPPSLGEHAGHHNLAWQISGDTRFDPSGLTLEKLLPQLASFDGDAVLSSEDFESILDSPTKLNSLVAPIQDIGWTIRLVVYFRDAHAYAESLYLELLRHGYSATFRLFRREIRLTGRLRYRDWIFHFKYDHIRRLLAAWQPGVLIERNYDVLVQTKSVVLDFLNVVGVAADAVGANLGERPHGRPPLQNLLESFLVNRLQRNLTDAEAAMMGDLFRHKNMNLTEVQLVRLFSAATADAITSDARVLSALVANVMRRPSLIERLMDFELTSRR